MDDFSCASDTAAVMVKLKFSIMREVVPIRKCKQAVVLIIIRFFFKEIVIFDWEENFFKKLNLGEILEKKQNWWSICMAYAKWNQEFPVLVTGLSPV